MLMNNMGSYFLVYLLNEMTIIYSHPHWNLRMFFSPLRGWDTVHFGKHRDEIVIGIARHFGNRIDWKGAVPDQQPLGIVDAQLGDPVPEGEGVLRVYIVGQVSAVRPQFRRKLLYGQYRDCIAPVLNPLIHFLLQCGKCRIGVFADRQKLKAYFNDSDKWIGNKYPLS